MCVGLQVFLKKEQLSLDVIKQCRVVCPAGDGKQRVLKDMILPNCEKLGQTIIFVRTKDNARQLHAVVCESDHCIIILDLIPIIA